MATHLNQELARDAIFDLADQCECKVVFYPLVGDVCQAVCRGPRASYRKLVIAMGAIGLETPLQHVERCGSNMREWEMIVRVPDGWTPINTTEDVPAARS